MPHRKEGKKMQHKQIPRALGFTLVELLVVISIIALLIAITVPVVGRATESARKAQARTELASIVTAIRGYYNEYGRMPQGSGQVDYSYLNGNAELINILRAQDALGNANHISNRRRIVFMEVSDRSLDDTGNFVDPWQRQRPGSYRVVVDSDFNNSIQTTVHGVIEGHVAVAWSIGPPPPNDGGDLSRHIKSWE
jgi:prepilin-type N-terminal cleavage/methylation domain-containing protein